MSLDGGTLSFTRAMRRGTSRSSAKEAAVEAATVARGGQGGMGRVEGGEGAAPFDPPDGDIL